MKIKKNKNSLHNLSGEQKDQHLILVDKLGNTLGTATRKECHSGYGKPHLAFMAFIKNQNMEIILTKRSQQKSLWPKFWDASVVSHVLPNETVEQAAERRSKEELGLVVKFHIIDSFYYQEKYGKNSENEYCYVLLGTTDQEPQPNPVEIEDLQTVKIETLKDIISNQASNFTPWLKIAISKINLS